MSAPHSPAPGRQAGEDRRSGRLIVIVGPSGAGKDTLIDHVRALKSQQTDVDFDVVRRVITRPVEAGGEAHQAADPLDFRRMKDEGHFCVSWEAHGLAYGIPVETCAAVAAGGICLVNGSRRALPHFRAVFPQVETVLVTARPAILAERLAARGRETVEDIRARLERRVEDRPEDYDLVIANEGPIEEGAARLLAFLRQPATVVSA
ncbi:phosphonate metabolism protein/1,5-bisphosphokinase (PRPP-forming) PhnN [Xaviernesmea oryzae]|uniref:Ribose 1,5-bisphosphate phosphokinase PhnN n=1 Tax=Xaviernesmea oryzae TaxID=464029 RepID=A0A1Q9B2F8_9HYPH|nr:phosphonate metabolism protein/1,5-bisphosphokinase (PRPP-forming) PhnN [Xaviernesmea oryzae]OLP62195.1 phosphonate metabolism protein/1,5-bisphosphokinase (PRPP-forming) PhnN [Xaviernesmea oryzae]SEL91292.1 ribose 1,5-bisphosphokinase [Xaviernesmea oryzae]